MRRTVMMLLPLAWLPTWAHAQIAPATPASTKPPVLVAPTPLTLPKITERLLPNGLKLVIVEQHEIPVVDVSLVIRTGAEADPTGKAGLATLTANLLDEGAGTRDALALAEQIGYLVVHFREIFFFDPFSRKKNRSLGFVFFDLGG